MVNSHLKSSANPGRCNFSVFSTVEFLPVRKEIVNDEAAAFDQV
jgi:hypothetical protein